MVNHNDNLSIRPNSSYSITLLIFGNENLILANAFRQEIKRIDILKKMFLKN